MSARNFIQQSSRELTADVGVAATFVLSSFWNKECNIINITKTPNKLSRDIYV